MKKYKLFVLMAAISSLSFAQQRVAGNDSTLVDPGIEGRPDAIKITTSPSGAVGDCSYDTIPENTLQPPLLGLSLNARVLPEKGTSQEVLWEVVEGDKYVTIATYGEQVELKRILNSPYNGVVRVRATSKTHLGVSAELPVRLRNFLIPVSDFSIKATEGELVMTPLQQTLHLEPEINPQNAAYAIDYWVTPSNAKEERGAFTLIKKVNGTFDVELYLKTWTEDQEYNRKETGLNRTATIRVKGFASSIVVSGDESRTEITPAQNTLQLHAALNDDAMIKEVTWSLVSGGDCVTLSPEGLLSANGNNKNGTIVVRATAKDGSGVYGELSVTVKDFVIKASSVSIGCRENTVELTPVQRELHLTATVLPEDATDKSVKWSIVTGENLAGITQDGVLTVGLTNLNGTVLVRATANDGSGIYGELTIPVKDFIMPAGSVAISCRESTAKLTPSQRNLHFIATVLPETTTDKTVVWSIVSGEELASLTQDGVLTVKDINVDGVVKVRAAMKSDMNIVDEISVPVEGFIVKASSITVTTQESGAFITPSQREVHLSARVLPENTTDKSVSWSLVSGTELVVLSETGVLSANNSNKNGTVVVRATAQDGSAVYGDLTVTVKDFVIKVASVSVACRESRVELTPVQRELHLFATILPEDATNQSVTWSIVEGGNLASITTEGVLSVGISNLNGTVVVRATANDGSGKYGELTIAVKDFIMPAGSVKISCRESEVKLTPAQKSLHFSADILPETTSDKSVTWSIVAGGELAAISSDGVLTVKDINVDGNVKVRVVMNSDVNIADEIIVPVEGFVVKASSVVVSTREAEAILTPSQTSLHLLATILPGNTTDKSIVWSMVSGEDLAVLSSEGVLSSNGSNKNGTVVVRATANDGSGKYGELTVTVKDFIMPAGSVKISCRESEVKLTPAQKSLHFSADILPETTSDKSVTWSIVAGGELAAISSDGVLTVKDINVDGNVKVRVVMNSDVNIADEIIVPVEGFVVKASSVVVSTREAEAILTSSQTSLHLLATVLPGNTTDKSIVWSMVSGEDLAVLSSEGVLSSNGSNKNGTVVVRATANDGSGKYGELTIAVKDFIMPAGSVKISCRESEVKLTPAQKSLHFSADILPETTSDKSVTWSIVAGGELAAISSDGVLTVKDINVDGNVKVRVVMNSDADIADEITVPVEGFVVKASSVVVSTREAEAILTPSQTSLHLLATVLPENATDKSVIWSITNGDDLVTLSSEGLLSVKEPWKTDGTITVRATTKDDSNVYGELTVVLKGFSVGIASAEGSKLRFYPAPVKNTLNVSEIPFAEKGYVVSIFTLSGQLIYVGQSRESTFFVDCSSYPQGGYILKIVINKTITVTRNILKD